VRWKVTLRRNGALVLSTRRTTRAPSGSFEVNRIVSGGTISARAVSPSGEVCTAKATLG
jgi:predicted ATP-dependent serine protease